MDLAQNLNYTRPWLYPKQEEAIFCDERFAVVEASTKSGKTIGCLIWIFEKALNGEPGQNFWWVAPVNNQADIAWRRLQEAIPREIYTTNETYKKMSLINGTTIYFKSAENPDSLFGEDVYAAVIDEASRVREESWHAVRSTLTATRGPVRIIGNVKGKKNWAYRLARAAQNGAKNHKYMKITAHDAVAAGVLAREEIEEAKRQLPENVFKELYLAEPADDGGNPFGLDAIRKCVAPMSTDVPVCWGWDVAKSINYTVGIALDRDGHVCRFYRFKTNWEETIQRITVITDGLPALVDSTGVGDQIIERLRRDANNFTGYKFSAKSKQDLMVGLAAAIQHREITFPDGQIVKELEMFEYDVHRDYTLYSAPLGYNDDCVDSLALAVKLWRSRNRFAGDATPILMNRASPWKIH